MILGTLPNGWTIIAVPSDPPAPMTVAWDFNDMIGEVASPYSGQAQQQDWMTDWLTAKVSMAPMPVTQASPWVGFFAELRGRLNAFPLGDALTPAPRGQAIAPTGVLVKGAQAARLRTLNTRGWAPSEAGQLLIGDTLQLGGALNPAGQIITPPRLHWVIAQNVNSDGNGDATISLYPSLREPVNDGDAVTLTNACGLVRLASNARSFVQRRDKLYTFAFDVKEAL